MIFFFFLGFFFLVVGLIFAVFLHFKYHHPTQAQIHTDLKSLQRRLRKSKINLNIWTAEDLNLLCSKAHPTKRLIDFKEFKSGLLKTIYDEPLVQWTAYHYRSEPPNMLCYFEVSDWKETYSIRLKGETAYIFEDETHVATFDKKWLFTSPSTQNTLLEIKPLADLAGFEVRKSGHLIAVLNPLDQKDKLNPRVFSWVHATLTHPQELALFAVVFTLLQHEKGLPTLEAHSS